MDAQVRLVLNSRPDQFPLSAEKGNHETATPNAGHCAARSRHEEKRMEIDEGVFILKDENQLIAMQNANFVTENDLQRLLASFPALLAGNQIDTEAPRRFVLVSREQPIPSEEGGPGRWSVDHLFLDQDGIPRWPR
jgi:hypothetical protein